MTSDGGEDSNSKWKPRDLIYTRQIKAFTDEAQRLGWPYEVLLGTTIKEIQDICNEQITYPKDSDS